MAAHGQHRTGSRAAARLTAIGTVAVLTVLGLWQAVSATTTTTTTRTTTTSTTTVDTWADLKADLATAGTGTVQLGSNITQSSGDYLKVPAGSSPTLDLNGKSLEIASPGWNGFPWTHAAVGVPLGAGLTITSSGPGGSLTATGGGGSAGIGGDYTPDYGSGGHSAGDVTIRGGSVTAIGGPSYYGPYSANGGAAGIGGGVGGAGGSVIVSGGSVTAIAGGQDESNGADFGGAGIGGGFEGAGGSVTVSGGSVTATGASGGSGIGSGGWEDFGVPVPSAGSVTVSAGLVTATGGYGGAGIGGGANSPGGSVVIGAGAQVTASDDRPPLNVWDKPRYASAIGGGATSAGGTAPLGSLSNAGSLTLPGIYWNGAPEGAPDQLADAAVLYVTDGVTVENSGTIHGPGTINGPGTVHNTGSISFGSVRDASITGNSFALIFAITGAADWDWKWVYADTVAHAGWTLENPPTSEVTLFGPDENRIYWSPPDNSVFAGWFTAPTGGTQITDTTNLHDLAGDGPAQVRLWSRYLRMQTITFPTITNQTYGAADFNPSATASSSLPVTYTTGTPTVCTVASGKVHIISAGTCTITAQQHGDTTYGPAQQVSRSFTIAKAPITVIGRQAAVLTSLLGATFNVDVTNAITGTPAVSEPVTVSATTMIGRAVHCTGLTNAAGTAHCTISSLLPLKTGHYQINVAQTADYLPGTGTGNITLLSHQTR